MIGKLFSFIAPFKSHIFAMVGVIAVAAIGVAIMQHGTLEAKDKTIGVQSDRIGELVVINKDWSHWATQQQKLRNLEQENTRLLQEQLAVIETQATEQSEQLKRLEQNNAEVKELLGRRLPSDLRKLLNNQ